MLDEDWYARFDGAGESALPPDADLDPVTRGLLLFASQEAPLDTARYRITRHQSSPGGDWPDVRHSYIEITPYNLAPGLHRDNVATYGEPAAPATRSEEHKSELQSLTRIQSAVFCLTQK